MKTKLLIVLTLLVVLLGNVPTAKAQDRRPRVIGSTMPTPDGASEALEELLAKNPPTTETNKYFITNVTRLGTEEFNISVAAIETDNNGRWQFAGDKALPALGRTFWVGSMRVTMLGKKMQAEYLGLSFPKRTPKMAALSLVGGGSAVHFPWEAGKSMMYGIAGVHGAGQYGLEGGVFVDFLGGDNLGTNVASDVVYAVDEGTIIWVCNDEQTVAVLTENIITEEQYVYAHLLDNANLVEEHSFMETEAMGTLKHGSFLGADNGFECGGADQQPTNYHLHFGLVPVYDSYLRGHYVIEGCVLTIATTTTSQWSCGSMGLIVKPGQWLTGGGGAPCLPDDPCYPGSQTRGMGFFDFILMGFKTILSNTILRLLPEHNDVFNIPQIMFNAFKLSIYTIWVLAWGNLDLLVISGVLITIAILEALRMTIIIVLGIGKLLAAIVKFFV